MENEILELYKKYDRPGPRYTSYPAYPHWENTPTQSQWIDQLKKEASQRGELPIDLYIHIPYCESLCLYCGCNRNITKNLDKGVLYTELLLKEWEIYKEEIPHIKIKSLHFGGGTPTFLKVESFKSLFEKLSPSLEDSFLGAIEIDPRVTTKDQIQYLASQGVKRFSLGIQDFNYEVQKVINRIQPQQLVEDILKLLKDHGSESINFDLIYGLPKQTPETLKETISLVKELRPDTIALYSYAHVPWKSPAQKTLEKHIIPEGESKRHLYNLGKELLEKAGYKELGLDHFSLESDNLYKSYKKGTMKRTFMGYTTQATNHLVGLGVSSISSTPYGHIQNKKEVHSYERDVEQGKLPFFYGHTQNKIDLTTSQAIHDLMCGKETDLSELLDLSSFEQKRKIKGELEEMTKDKIITFQKNILNLTPTGLPFLRNIAMALDYRLKDTHRFSRTI